MTHTAVQVFAVNPAVVRCSCGKRVICHPGALRAHLTTGEGGDNFPWPQPTEDA